MKFEDLIEVQKKAYNEIEGSTEDVVVLSGVKSSGKSHLIRYMALKSFRNNCQLIMLSDEEQIADYLSKIVNIYEKKLDVGGSENIRNLLNDNAEIIITSLFNIDNLCGFEFYNIFIDTGAILIEECMNIMSAMQRVKGGKIIVTADIPKKVIRMGV